MEEYWMIDHTFGTHRGKACPGEEELELYNDYYDDDVDPIVCY